MQNMYPFNSYYSTRFCCFCLLIGRSKWQKLVEVILQFEYSHCAKIAQQFGQYSQKHLPLYPNIRTSNFLVFLICGIRVNYSYFKHYMLFQFLLIILYALPPSTPLFATINTVRYRSRLPAIRYQEQIIEILYTYAYQIDT